MKDHDSSIYYDAKCSCASCVSTRRCRCQSLKPTQKHATESIGDPKDIIEDLEKLIEDIDQHILDLLERKDKAEADILAITLSTEGVLCHK